MSTVNLGAIDLNLLHVVATVLEERSATKAAARLAVTQSAVSNALKRARELFGDPLVAREPHGLCPTPRGHELLPALRAWLEEARRLVSNAPTFQAESSQRTFTIACSDAVAIALLGPLLRLLGKRAPQARLRLMTLERLISHEGLARGEIDLWVGIPPVIPPGHAAELLYRDPMCCVVERKRKQLSLRQYAELPHVELALFGAIDDTVDRALARRGLSRTVAVAVPHFASVPLAVLETRGVATLARRLARAFAARMPLSVLAAPLPLEPIQIRQVWHRRSENDAAVCFLRDQLRAAARMR